MKILIVGSGGREHAHCMEAGTRAAAYGENCTVHRETPALQEYAQCVNIGVHGV